MRTAVLIAVSALAITGCDAVHNPFAKKAAPPAASAAAAQAPALPTASAPAPESPPGGAVTPEKAVEYPPASVTTAPAPVRFSPADYAKRERRLAALIANAETRDTSGETQRRAEEGRYRRSRCATKACIEQSYASEEAWLRQWEGSGDSK